MKNKLTLVAVAAVLLAGTPAYALSKTQVASIKEALNVPAPEMPAKAVSLVKAAPEKEQEDVALTAVRTILSRHPAAAPVVVAAISRELPELSAAVAKAAVLQAPDQRASIEKAARSAAPGQSAAISSAASQAGDIASAAAPNTTADLSAPVASREAEVRSAANHRGSHGVIVTRPGPILYHRPLPNPPNRPINPPGLKNFFEPRVR